MKLGHLRFRLVLVACVLALSQPLAGDDRIELGTRLASLAKVWGLLKYFHPQVAQGTLNWDAALTDAIPHVNAAETRSTFNGEVIRLIRRAGTAPRPPAGAPVDQPETDPAFGGIDNEDVSDQSTIAALKTIRHSAVPLSNRYVRTTASGNPDFSAEAPYDAPAYPNEGMRLLPLFRFWNMVQYFAPNRDIMDRDWSQTLEVLLPRFIEAADAVQHAEFTLMALRTAPDVTVVGSPTAGADGNVSLIALPGGLRTYFSGLGVYYPDRSPTQRVGIVPDAPVTPTVEGIRNGVDEVLEHALRLVR